MSDDSATPLTSVDVSCHITPMLFIIGAFLHSIEILFQHVHLKTMTC